MLETDGEMNHRPAISEQVRIPDRLGERARAVSVDEGSGETISLRTIWDRLEQGQLEIVDHFTTATRCYLVVHERVDPAMRKLERRGVLVLKRVLVEGCQNAVAIELGIAASTVATLGRVGMLTIGLRCRVQNTPYIVALAANAAHHTTTPSARSGSLPCDGETLQVLSILRPESRVHHLLSPAVLAVTRSLLEGKLRSDIASARNTSERTVANQLAAAFRQLRASSRLDLLRVLAHSQSRAAMDQP
jgi:DNA-binding CsgD family transcriptional regulator